MSHVDGTERSDKDFITFLRTILMILENHNFKNTALIFQNECNELGYHEVTSCKTPQDTKSSPKIIFENFSKSPYRIIIEDNIDQTLDSNPQNNNVSVNIDSSNNENNADRLSETYTKIESDIKDFYIIVDDETEQAQETISKQNNDNQTNEFNEKVEHQIEENSEVLEQEETFEKPTNISLKNLNNKDNFENSSKCPEYDILKNKFTVLQIEHQKLMDIVTELTYALQTSIKGQIDDTRVILNNCEKIYPELFYSKPKKFSTEIIPKNMIENINQESNHSREIKTNNEVVNNDLKNTSELVQDLKPCFNLDFQKIKHDLKDADLETKLLLLQALRWRLTKTPNQIREQIIKTYIRYDILNVHSCTHKSGFQYPKNSIVFTSFYCACKSPQILQQTVTRFVNALASVKIGRDYIIHQSVILNILLSVMLGTHPSTPQIDTITRNMIIATLQKISLRYSSRLVMITDGLTEFIAKFLISNYKSLNDYCLEYSIALLRNLWLHSESREKCHTLAYDIIKLLANLLDEQFQFCLPYVTGSLYNLLPDHYFHKAAKSINLEEVILYRIEKSEGDMKEQLQYILEIYLNPDNWQPLCECDLGGDAENEIDVIEPEIDQNENFHYSNTHGEQFLYNYRMTYSLDGSDINPTYINNIFSNPVTPNVSSTKSANNSTSVKCIPEIEYLEYAAQFLNERMNKQLLSITNSEQKDTQVDENVTEQQPETVEEKPKINDIEMTFCEDTQQLYYAPSKNRIFETDDTYKLHAFSPSFLKTIGDHDAKNISKSMPQTPRDAEKSEKSDSRTARYLSPTVHLGLCYRQGFKPRSLSDSSVPHIGFCNENAKNNKPYVHSKYSCDCFAEMKRSFDEENKKDSEKVDEKTQNEIKEPIPTKYCKYKYANSNSAPLQKASKKERDISTSKSLDESDYSSVFESRPKLLRTP